MRRAFSCRLLLLAAAAIGGCAVQRFIQPAASGLAPSQVANIVTAQVSKKNGFTVSLQRVRDPQGRDVINLNMLAVDLRNTAVVVPGRYEIEVVCSTGTQMTSASGEFELRSGYTYVLDCVRENGFWVRVVAAATPTGANR